ncbi:MAG TPA: glycoside hydrolase family 16 protein [Paracoccaceae bacterium]|nr:glycoside hydrolase family 16 protein [Paracoccaceae bacterium]
MLAAMAALALAAGASAQEPPKSLAAQNAAVDLPMAVPEGATLVWSDEFDTPGLPDPARWTYDTAWNEEGWFNDEKQYYAAARAENARVEDGHLLITARREALTEAEDYGGQHYASARLLTKSLAQWTTGFVEVRARLACGRGIWPAIWMLGADDATGWPGQGEIDIMEHVGWDEGVVHGTIHTEAYNHVAGTQVGAETRVPDACTAFHTYQLDWSPERILIGIDGRAYMRFENDGSGDPARWPFNAPQYLILNVAVGGWGGAKGIDDDAFPATMAVDYVRVWQPNG